jgi:molybdopterin synthase catalytic subunit
VIHHAQDYETRERNFEKVYEAYLKGDIDDGAISFYLGRMYEMKNGERLRMESPYRAEDEINQLIKELNLEKKKANAQQRI